ncbi:MAG: shikimate kinase [Flavobacteriaceae bacterium]
MKKIILLGYMGAGKSSVGSSLSEISGIKHYDLDRLVESSEQKSIAEIFKTKGEVYFRKIESKVFKETLSKKESLILSLGGGTPCYANNHLLLHQDGVFSVYLKTSVETLVKRLHNKKHTRPLIAELSDDGLSEYINKHLFDRNFYYHQAELIINTDDKTSKEIANEIYSRFLD